jgi:hypothetical protein
MTLHLYEQLRGNIFNTVFEILYDVLLTRYKKVLTCKHLIHLIHSL